MSSNLPIPYWQFKTPEDLYKYLVILLKRVLPSGMPGMFLDIMEYLCR